MVQYKLWCAWIQQCDDPFTQWTGTTPTSRSIKHDEKLILLLSCCCYCYCFYNTVHCYLAVAKERKLVTQRLYQRLSLIVAAPSWALGQILNVVSKTDALVTKFCFIFGRCHCARYQAAALKFTACIPITWQEMRENLIIDSDGNYLHCCQHQPSN